MRVVDGGEPPCPGPSPTSHLVETVETKAGPAVADRVTCVGVGACISGQGQVRSQSPISALPQASDVCRGAELSSQTSEALWTLSHFPIIVSPPPRFDAGLLKPVFPNPPHS